jgi:hypothetical protein
MKKAYEKPTFTKGPTLHLVTAQTCVPVSPLHVC